MATAAANQLTTQCVDPGCKEHAQEAGTRGPLRNV